MDVTGHLTETLPSQAWAPVLISIRQTLRHCTFRLLPAECSAANLAKLYGSLKRCTLLESLGILCVIRGHDTNPFLFLDAFADLLASADQGPPFPRLVTLSLEFQQDREIALEGCADACTKLARALGDRSRYPHLKRLAVCASLNGWGMRGSLSIKEQREEQNTFLRSLLERVEQVGVQLEISVPG